MRYFKLIREPYSEETKGFLSYEEENLEEKTIVKSSNYKSKKSKI